MKTLNYSKLTQHILGFAGLVVAGTVVGLPASAQVESPSVPLGAPSVTTPKEAPEDVTPEASEAPTSDIPAVDDAIESTIDSVQQSVTPGTSETEATEAAKPEATEATETEVTEATETEATETEATETEATETGATEATETEATETEATETEATETEATETEATETEATETEASTQSKPATSGVAPNGEAAPTTTAPTTSSPTSEAPETETTPSIAAASGTIVDVASASDTFQTLVSALTAAELAELLQGEGPFTVFAPTDEAFAALPPGVLDELLKPENREILVKVLQYHVVPGAVMSTDLASGAVETTEGSPVNVTVGTTGGVKVNDANVVQADIPATNGVIHAIDRVIIPPDLL